MIPQSEAEEAEAEPECEEGFVLENGGCAVLDTSNCGGVPCTASDKENSTTSDPSSGEPHTPKYQINQDDHQVTKRTLSKSKKKSQKSRKSLMPKR